MTSPVWQLDQHRARLRLAQLAAVIDLLHPAEGLVSLHHGTDAVGHGRLLGIEIPSFPAGEAKSRLECHVRGSCLMASYRESGNWPIHVAARWRAEGPSSSHGSLATIELMVSVQTHRLDSRPELAVQSVIPSIDVFRLVDEAAARFEALGREPPAIIEPAGGPGCLVFRLAGSDLSYAEMVHPLDFLHDRLQASAGSGPMIHMRHQLFRRPLEKGVILRARVRGVFVRRDDDIRIAAQCYASFSATGPPLGT